jgi:hypothetical protein
LGAASHAVEPRSAEDFRNSEGFEPHSPTQGGKP